MQYSPRREDKADNTWALADATAHRRLMRLIRCEKKSLQSLDSIFYSWISPPAFVPLATVIESSSDAPLRLFLSLGFIIIPVTAAGFCGASDFFFPFFSLLAVFFPNSFGYFPFSLSPFVLLSHWLICDWPLLSPHSQSCCSLMRAEQCGFRKHRSAFFSAERTEFVSLV